ncbi:hypothetical protein BGZ95_006044, partial [Linnemannia exigua]
ELTDHLVELFFEHCFQDFDNFDPKEFLKDYAERKVNPSLLNAICAVAARFSDHPDIVQVLPYHSGEPYAEKTREKIMDLIDEATINNLHALLILSFYEYSAWSGPRGWRFGGLASRMGIELYLHNQRDIPTSEAARVKFETKCRTFWNLIHIDIFSAASAGLPSVMDIKLYNIQLPEYRPDWWVEKYQELEAAIIGEVQEDSDFQETISNQPETVPKDPFATRILAKLQKQKRLRGYGPAKYLFEPIELLFRVSQYINGNTLESDKCPSDPTSEFAVLEGRLANWIKTVAQVIPATPAEIVGSEDNLTFMIVTYYMTVIMLHRPIIALEDVVDASFIDQSRVRCADAATKITEIVEHFNETDIKYRGHLFVFQVFTGAAIHITNIFSSDDALAVNAKRCLNVHLNFLKISSATRKRPIALLPGVTPSIPNAAPGDARGDRIAAQGSATMGADYEEVGHGGTFDIKTSIDTSIDTSSNRNESSKSWLSIILHHSHGNRGPARPPSAPATVTSIVTSATTATIAAASLRAE